MGKSNSRNLLDLRLLGRILRFARPYKGTLFLAVFLSVTLAAISPLRPYLIQVSVDVYIFRGLWTGLIWICVLQLLVLIVESGLRFWFLYRMNWLGQTVVDDMRRKVFEKVIHQNTGYFDRTPIGTLTTRTINDMEAVKDMFSEGIISIVADVLTIIAIMAFMFYTDWRLTLICLSTFPLLLLATYIFKESVRKSFQRVRQAVAHLNAFAQEHIGGMYLVQVFNAQAREMKKFERINREHRNANIKAIFAYSVFFPVVEIILATSLGLLIWWGAGRIVDHEVTVGVLIAFVLYLNLLFRPLRMLADKFNVLQMGMIAGERVLSVLDSKEYMADTSGLKVDRLQGEIAFDEVVFQYAPGRPVLRKVSFQLPARQTLAVVGPTGAGKSSLINIINRLYEVSEGVVRIDGRDIKDYDLYNLRSHIGIVLQDVFLFSGSIVDNITLKNPDISIERVIEVCQTMGIHEFIMRLPGGYDFKVMERGASLSHGQRQLISFARALLYDPSILILDEATASIDSESEILIQKAIDTLISGRTSIVIAHRLSTIRKADQILVMDRGEIVERGSHASLIRQKGKYYDLYTAVEKQREESW